MKGPRSYLPPPRSETVAGDNPAVAPAMAIASRVVAFLGSFR